MDKRYVLDTHALFWYLTASPKLSPKAKDIIDKGLNSECTIIISTITLAELYFLNEKLGLPLNFLNEYKKIIAENLFEIIPVKPENILLFEKLSDIKEMHDRIIASVALECKAVLITRDKEVTRCNKIKVMW